MCFVLCCGVSWCVVRDTGVGVHVVWHAENTPVRRFKPHSCVHSRRLRVCRHNAHVCSTRGRLDGTHKGVVDRQNNTDRHERERETE